MTNRRKELSKSMRLERRILISAALAIGLAGAPAPAQESEPQGEPQATGVIGPPQLREFELPGTTTTPAPSTQTTAPAATAPEPAIQQPPVIVLPDVPQAPVVEAQRPAVAPSPSPASETASGQPESVASETQTEPTVTDVAGPDGNAVAAPPASAEEPAAADAEPVAQPAPLGGGIPWLYIALAALLGAVGAIAFMKLRARQDSGEQEEVEEAEEQAAVIRQPVPAAPPAQAPVRVPAAAPPPAPEPAAAPAAASDGVVGIQIRPWLNLEFRPAQAAATLTEAVVQFELLVTNSGNAIARNVRIEARMFNAGADQDREISDFFASPVDPQTRSRILAIPPRSGARMRSRVAMPKESVREITVDGRRLFIPMVAINVVYEWGEGRTGQTSMSYLVGREPETPSTKMGAFRLDLGPRVYRSVGQRPSNVAVLV